MIHTFKHSGLKQYFETGKSKGIPSELVKQIRLRLNALDRAKELRDMNLPGFNFHPLKGQRKGEYSVHVSGPWALTFKFDGTNVLDLNLENYH